MFIHTYIHTHIHMNKTYFAQRKTISAFTREFSLPKPVHLFTCMVMVLKELRKGQGLHPTEHLFTQHNQAGPQHSLARGLVLVLFISQQLQDY